MERDDLRWRCKQICCTYEELDPVYDSDLAELGYINVPEMNGNKLMSVAAALDIFQFLAVPLLEMIAQGVETVEDETFEVCMGYSKAQFRGMDVREFAEWASGTTMQDDLREWANALGFKEPA